MSETELFSLRPLLSFESLISSQKNKDLFNIDSVDDFETLCWTAGGRFDGREFVVIACKSKSKSKSESESKLSTSDSKCDIELDIQGSDCESQQYLIIRSVNALPQKLRSKYRRRSKRKHAKLVKDSNIQHLYGDIYHIDVDDIDIDTDIDIDIDIDIDNIDNIDRDDESDGIHSVSSVDSKPPDIQNFGKNFGPIVQDTNIDYNEYEELPVLRIITWFKTKEDNINEENELSLFDKTIVSMDFNPSGSWLMVTCKDCSIYLLPLRNFLEIPTHQLELSVTTAYELNNNINKTDDEFFEQQFGFVNQSNDMKRGGMMKKDGSNIGNISSTSLAHLVLHRGKSNKTKSNKGKSILNWFGNKKSNFNNGNTSFSFKNMSDGTIRQGYDISEQLEDEVCADGNELFGPQHDLTIISHGIIRHNNNNNICCNCSLWWTTRAKKDYVIFGTNDGRICLINIRSHKKTWIEIGNNNINIISFELIIDIKSSSILIHCTNNMYYILLLERPYKKNRDQHGSLHGALNAQMSQELLMAGYLLNNMQENKDPSKITQWDTIIDYYQLNAFKPLQLNLTTQSNESSSSNKSLSSNNNNNSITLSVYHNTGSVIADPHQQTPTPSEKAARIMGLPYPRRRIVANNNNNNNDKPLSSISLSNINEDPLRTEHAQSCVHFGVFYNKQSKLALHALDEIYQPPRAGFKIQPSLQNVFAHNFIISLAPNNQYNQINIIAPPLASLMGNPNIYDEYSDSDDDDDDDEYSDDNDNDDDDDEIILSSNSSNNDNISIQNTQDMLSDIDDEIDENENKDQNKNKNKFGEKKVFNNLNLKRALLRHRHNKNNNKIGVCNIDKYNGIIQELFLDADESVVGILDRTTSVIMSSPSIYIERLDPLDLSQLNKDATNAYDVTITPTMSKSEIPYSATHSVWSSLKSPYLLLLTNKAVYQIDKVFDGFSTVLESVEKSIEKSSEINANINSNIYNNEIINGLSACCEVNSKSIHEIAADRMLAHNSKINDAEIAFELYSRSSVTVAKLIRQFLRPEWLHDEKHDIIVNKIFGILKRLLTTADIPSRITFSDIMFNLLLLQYHIHHPFLNNKIILSYHTNKIIEKIININNRDRNSNSNSNSNKQIDNDKETESQLRRRKLIHFVSLNRECSLKMVINKLLNIDNLDLALHVLQSHDHPGSIGSNANLPIGSGPAVAIAQAAALKQAQSNISLNVTGNLTDFFLSITSKLGTNLNDDTASFIIKNYPLLFLEKKLDLNTIPKQFWVDIIFNMLDKVVKLCENTTNAQRYYQTQQLFRQRKQQQNYHEQYVKQVEQEEKENKNKKKNKNKEKEKNEQEEEKENEKEKEKEEEEIIRSPKSFQEETRMRQKQLVQYLSINIKLFNLKQLNTINLYLNKLTKNIYENINNNNNEDFDALSWSTPGWLLLHLKVLLRIRYYNKIKYNKWDKFGNDKYCKQFEIFLDDVLIKFTGMLDITLILDEILKYNDLPIAMILHEKLENYHDYIITFIRFLLNKPYKNYLKNDTQYRNIILDKIIHKLLLLKPSKQQQILLQNSKNKLNNSQGRCLAHLIALWMKLKLSLNQIENIACKNFDDLKYGLTNVLFYNWSHHQTYFDNNTMPQFSPKIMLKITSFALQTQKNC